MTREELFNALREVASEEFAHIPNEEDIAYEFSERFNKKMDKLFKKIERNCTYPTVRISKRIITILAAILIIFAGLMSVSAIREPIVNFIVEKYEIFVEFFFSGDISEQIEYEYGFSEIPDGFDLVTKTSDYDIVHSEYKNETTGDEIVFTQTITDGLSLSVDNEHGTITNESINNVEVCVYKHENGKYIQANWTSQTYSLTLIYYGDIEKDEFLKLIESIE